MTGVFWYTHLKLEKARMEQEAKDASSGAKEGAELTTVSPAPESNESPVKASTPRGVNSEAELLVPAPQGQVQGFNERADNDKTA